MVETIDIQFVHPEDRCPNDGTTRNGVKIFYKDWGPKDAQRSPNEELVPDDAVARDDCVED